MAAQPHDGHDGCHDGVHRGTNSTTKLWRPTPYPGGCRCAGQTAPAPGPPDEGFHHADGVQILLDHQVQIDLVDMEAVAQPHSGWPQDPAAAAAPPGIPGSASQADGQGHDQGGDQHYRGPDQHAHAHHPGSSCTDETSLLSRVIRDAVEKCSNVRRGEPLHLGIFRGADVGAGLPARAARPAPPPITRDARAAGIISGPWPGMYSLSPLAMRPRSGSWPWAAAAPARALAG